MAGTAIITGGGRGIGRAVALALSADGWNVVVAGRTQESLDATVASLPGDGLAVVTDVSRPGDVEALFGATLETVRDRLRRRVNSYLGAVHRMLFDAKRQSTLRKPHNPHGRIIELRQPRFGTDRQCRCGSLYRTVERR